LGEIFDGNIVDVVNVMYNFFRMFNFSSLILVIFTDKLK